jgi:hypothetical protein
VSAHTDIGRFEQHVQHALVELHPTPARIRTDPDLCRVLVGLYESDDIDTIWATVLAPYLRQHGAGLRNVWREHAIDSSFELLDLPEALIVFERAEQASVRFRQSWPGPASWLARISDVWGVSL